MSDRPGRHLESVDKIIVHHSATKDSGTLSWTAIERYHEGKGWDGIGYHAGIEFVRDGYVVILGRPEDRTGAHTIGHNHNSLSFVFVGNYDVAPPSQEMLDVAATRWFVPVMARYGLDESDIYAHRSFAAKTCPGKKFSLKQLREAIQSFQ